MTELRHFQIRVRHIRATHIDVRLATVRDRRGHRRSFERAKRSVLGHDNARSHVGFVEVGVAEASAFEVGAA